MKRVLEPELMVNEIQCREYNAVSYRQYSNGNFIDSYNKYCGLSKGSLIDLGSGPAVYLEVMKKHFPDLSITGYEKSDKMIEYAKKNTTVTIIKEDFNKINNTADCVLCLYTMHHQHDPIKFWKTVSKTSNGYVYIEDFERPKSEEMFEKFNAINDFKHSLRASFTLSEVKDHLITCKLNYTAIREPIDIDKKLYKIIVYQKM
jgi:trans-aconitate methyltransferase